jgi:hypothetical protein
VRLRLGLCLSLALAITGCEDCDDDDDHRPIFLPNSPGGIAAAALTTTTAQITWTDLSANENNFVVETSPDNVAWSDAKTVGQDATTTVIGGLVPGAQLWVRVVSSNAGGRSPPAGPVTVSPPTPTWSPRTAGPAALIWSCAALDPTRNLMFVFGGNDGFGGDSNLLYACNLSLPSPAWSTVSLAAGNTPPTARYGSSMIYDPLRDRLVVFGGQIGLSSTDELWEFRITTSEWSPIPTTGSPPAARQHHSAVYDSLFDRMVIYGGEAVGVSSFFPDVHTLALPATGPQTWSSFPSGSGPLPRSRHSAVYDGDARRVIVFAGIDNNLADGSIQALDLWTLDLSVAAPLLWAPLATAGTPPGFRDGHTAVWDSVNGQMVVYGGADDLGTVFEEVWTLTLGAAPTWRSWTPVTTAGPRQYGVAAFDPLSVRMFVFSGFDDSFTPTDQTWSLKL